MEQYYNFIQTEEKSVIDSWFDKLDADYAVGEAGVSDEVYDYLLRAYEQRFGKRNKVGAPPVKSASKLPIAMMSLDKIMTQKELNNFMRKNPGPYVVMDKINGNSGLYTVVNGVTRLYNRGDGTEGTDLTHILPYLNLPVLPFDVYVKGELVVDKQDYKPYRQDYRTNLSMVAGLLNSQSADPERLKLIRFIAFDMAFPSNQNIELNILQTLKYLVQYGFTIPFNTLTPILSVEWLSAFFKQQKIRQPYDVDGMVIVSNRPIKYAERLIRENPKYAVAYKEYGDEYETTVIDVIWEASKHGVIKPVVHVDPVAVGDTGFTIRKATGFNAKWIVDNKVGPGSRIMVTHNTIPYITRVIQSTYPKLPPPDQYSEESWGWNETGVDIILHEANDEVKIARIYEFFKQIGAKYWGETTLAKFYRAGYDTIKKMVETTRKEFLSTPIEGIGAGTIDRMIKTRDAALPEVTLPELMSGSGTFGFGMGRRKLKLVVDAYPNILDYNPTLDQILSIDGFAQKTAEKFIIGLPKFRQFIKEIPILEDAARGKLVSYKSPVVSPVRSPVVSPMSPLPSGGFPNGNTGESINGKSVVFTGFRDKALQNAIERAGGTVKTGVSKKVSYVLVGGTKGHGSAKERKAISYGIPVLSVEEFKQKFGF